MKIGNDQFDCKEDVELILFICDSLLEYPGNDDQGTILYRDIESALGYYIIEA